MTQLRTPQKLTLEEVRARIIEFAKGAPEEEVVEVYMELWVREREKATPAPKRLRRESREAFEIEVDRRLQKVSSATYSADEALDWVEKQVTAAHNVSDHG